MSLRQTNECSCRRRVGLCYLPHEIFAQADEDAIAGTEFFFFELAYHWWSRFAHVWGLLRIELKEIRISTMALLPSSENAAPQMQFSSTGTTDERLGRCVRCASAQAESHSIESPVDV